MDPEFWHQRWEQNQIGFHNPQVNEYLLAHWHEFAAAPGARVLVPLCGKSLDLIWLREQGASVLGVEISQLAVEAFFAEWGVSPRESASGALRCYSAGGVDILCGDFFHLEPVHVEGVSLIYDRAALVALPQLMRPDYGAVLKSLLPAAPQMLVCVDYPQHQMQGPPFAVGEEEVLALYEDTYVVHVLSRQDILARDANTRFRERGLTGMVETVYMLEPRQKS